MKQHSYQKALVIGKFMPLHKGHVSLINFATSQAEEVVVYATANKNECISLEQRLSWLRETMFNRDECVHIRGLKYDDTVLNSSSQSDMQSSIDWADFLKHNVFDFNEIDVIIGSEQYVKYMADYIGIDYIIYDENRVNITISATSIKSDIFTYWDYLPPAVKQTYAHHICICGSESTGKTTVCKHMEEKYNCVTMIPEIGRCLVGKSELCTVSKLCSIYDIHYELLKQVILDPPTPIVIWDTDNLTTVSYYKYLFPAQDEKVLSQNGLIITADKYFFFESNIDFVDDGTRFSESAAKRLRDNHLMVYKNHAINPELVDTNREQHVDNYIQSVIAKLSKAFN